MAIKIRFFASTFRKTKNDDINWAKKWLCYWMGRNCEGKREGGGGRADEKRGIWLGWL